MLYVNRIFSLLHAKRQKDLKSAEMTTNKCVVHCKVTETNIVQGNSEYLRKNKIKGNKKEIECLKRQNFNYVKCQ